MGDMEIHEHVLVKGKTGQLKNAIRHENFNSLSRYIEKHNMYSNWEANVFMYGVDNLNKASSLSRQALRRRRLKKNFNGFTGNFYFDLYRLLFYLA